MPPTSICGRGVAYVTGQWQPFALPCVPAASPASIANVLGTAPAANLPLAGYARQWILYGRNGTNSGNVALSGSATTLAPTAGYWLKSFTAPVEGTLRIPEGSTTPVEMVWNGASFVAQPGWGVDKGDYAADFRPADGAPDRGPSGIGPSPHDA